MNYLDFLMNFFQLWILIQLKTSGLVFLQFGFFLNAIEVFAVMSFMGFPHKFKVLYSVKK